MIAAVREEVARLDSSVPVYNVRSMQDVVAGSQGMAARRVLTATFALLALVLGAIGLFGVVAHDVASRRRVALRIALGADPTRILSTTLGQGGVMVGAGLVLGGLLSTWATRAVSSSGLVTGPFDALSLAVSVTALALRSRQ